MKTQRIVITVLAFIFLSTFSAIASPGDTMMVQLEKSGTEAIEIHLANLQQERTRVSITDFQGKVWFSEYIRRTDSYAKLLNMDGMPEGNYLLVVAQKSETFEQAFLKTTEGLAFFESATGSVVKPEGSVLARRVSKEAGSVILHVTEEGEEAIGVQMANLCGADLQIQISTLRGVSVFSQQMEQQHTYATKFSLEGLDAGKYFLKVSTEDFTELVFFQLNEKGVQIGQRQRLILDQLSAADFASN